MSGEAPVVQNPRKVRKARYITKLKDCLDNYKSALMINIDFVGSKQMQLLRASLRGRAVILMGKNTIMRKYIRERIPTNPGYESLLPLIKNNIGLVFCNGDLAQIRKEVIQEKIPAAAKTGAIAPKDCIIAAGPTGLDPGQTSFFQALNIGTKIVKGSIEIMTPVTIAEKGKKVSSSAVALLNKLNVKPFEYGITVDWVYDNGSLYQAFILDMTKDDLTSRFFAGVNTIAAIGLEIGYPTLASLPHSFTNAFRKLVAITLETDYMFPEAAIFKEMLANPGAFASAAPAAGGAAVAAAKAPEPEPEPEEEADMGFSLFD